MRLSVIAWLPRFVWVATALCITLACCFAVSTSKTSTNHLAAGLTSAGLSTELKGACVGELIEETGLYQSIRLSQETPLYRKQSPYQMIEIFRSPFYGKILVLDGVIQLTERDGNSYNEMLAHVALFQHTHPRRILIVGGGDGHVLAEVIKHDSVEHVDHVELDAEVVETCKTYFPWSDAWKDPRVHLHIADGAKFVRNALDQSYDVVIQDSSDPWTWGENGKKMVLPSSVLYSPEHFTNLHRILKPNGVLNIQAESLQIPSDLNGIRDWRQLALKVGFQRVRYGSILISSYPTGQIGFLLCERDLTEATYAEVLERFTQMEEAKKSTSYYHPPLQVGAFALPLWAMNHIYDGKVSPLKSFPHDDEL